MNDRELVYVNDYHQRLITISQQERTLRQAKPARPGIRDKVLLLAGITLISLGEQLRSASVYSYEKPVELSQECA